MVNVSFSYRGKNFRINARKCSFFSLGLMFRSKDTMPCLFEFQEDSKFKISSYFVFFPFIAVWLDEKNKVVDLKKVEPFTFSVSSKKPFRKLVEIPISDKYSDKVKLLVGD
ncbi:MAG TPA: DUF192 domain-containing protein [Candidatus Pacearchaeota archaeon]|nr:DUF192 domain-containing protein [Candidatus Pacearchaeota archaeon]